MNRIRENLDLIAIVFLALTLGVGHVPRLTSRFERMADRQISKIRTVRVSTPVRALVCYR